MKKIDFYKMVASGNDFVVIDNRKKAVGDPAGLAREVCRAHTGVGADGVLLIENSKKADYKVRVLNPDGSEAEACGNGFRCTALLGYEKLKFPKVQRFEALAGLIEAEVKNSRVRVQLSDPLDFQDRREIEISGRKLHYFFIRTGVPHVVIFVEGLSKLPVYEIGWGIRCHSRFQPEGSNVNFVEVAGPHAIEVRTYERGVEKETLACGTGSAASAIVSVRAGHVTPPVQVKTQGGEILAVDFVKSGDEIRKLTLEGKAGFVFEGKWNPRSEKE